MNVSPKETVDWRSGAFGARLRYARETAGLSQEELAERAGLSPNTVGGLERGEHLRPYPATVRALADALGLSEGERAALFTGTSMSSHPAATIEVVSSGLPALLAPLIGRECEIEAVSTLLRAGSVRLVTLTGPGGVGKTALALKIATDLSADFAHGVSVIDLAAVHDPALVIPTVARGFGLAEKSGQPLLDHLRAALGSRHLLLILDNFEHLLDAAPLVTDLLSRCSHLAILVTSRAPLRVAGEYVSQVPPLQVPDPDRLPPMDELAEYASVRLFADRAQAATSMFVLSDQNAREVAALCHRLEGLPLAIELAAARTRLFTPAAMLPHLAQRLPLLIDGRRDAPERQRTLRRAIAWSYDLLTGDQQTLFRRMSVFVGGFTLDAAEWVSGHGAWGTTNVATTQSTPHTDPASPVTTSPSSVTLEDIAALVDQSLLRHEPGPAGIPRYLMLETIREYGVELLKEANETAVARDVHAAFFAALDGQLEPNRLGPGEFFDDRLLRIEADHPNYREALSHLAANSDAPAVLRLAGALAVLWHHRGRLREGRQWLEWALERTDDTTPWHGSALAGLSLIQWSQGDTESAAEAAERACAIATSTSDAELLALSVHVLGLVAIMRGDWDDAEQIMTEALVVQRAIGTPGYGAWALIALSTVAHQRSDGVASVHLVREALSMFRTIRNASGTAVALCTLAGLSVEQGDLQSALTTFQEALELWASIGERWAIAWALSGLAAVTASQGQPTLAATLIGVIDARLDESGAVLWQGGSSLYEWATSTAQAALGEVSFTMLRAAGRELPFAAAVAAGLAVDLAVGSKGPVSTVLGDMTLTVDGRGPAAERTIARRTRTSASALEDEKSLPLN